VRRLYSTFARGPAGIGLLLIRLGTGITVIYHALGPVHLGPLAGSELLYVFCIGLGCLLAVGLWTPLVGTLIALTALWDAVAHPVDRVCDLAVVSLGVGITLIGPGIWSLDARIFGWKRVEIRHRTPDEPPP
jgi:putative oxidoreductase